MGQYYKIVNLTKKEYLKPHAFGDGLKLLEFGSGGCGTMCALAILLSDGNGRGGGDLHTKRNEKLIGSWAGDKIVVTGDYADAGRFTFGEKNLYDVVRNRRFKNISRAVIRVMCQDGYIKQELRKATAWRQNKDLPKVLQHK